MAVSGSVSIGLVVENQRLRVQRKRRFLAGIFFAQIIIVAECGFTAREPSPGDSLSVFFCILHRAEIRTAR
jgi:hypothetical protein